MKQFSRSWNASKKARKQRKYRSHLPLHAKKKLVRVHLSKELHEKYKKRTVTARVEDNVKILRGQFSGKEGKIERVDRTYEHIYIAGVERVKKDGAKVSQPIHPSNLIILELKLDDKRRKEMLEVKK